MRLPHRSASAPMRVRTKAPLPVSSLLVGGSAEVAAEVLPRLFNLCRVTQGLAARMAFGLENGPVPTKELHNEILRDHVMKLCVGLPRHFGQSPNRIPQRPLDEADQVHDLLFGPGGQAPETPDAFNAFLKTAKGVAPLLYEIASRFRPGDACVGHLPTVSWITMFGKSPMENSVAGRQAHHPVMRSLEQEFGRGPLWRITARLYDALECLEGRLRAPHLVKPGFAIVPAARGVYGIKARVEQDTLVNFKRKTPTDHLLAPGGVLEQSLASLPANQAELAPLVLDILDPCSPVSLEAVDYA